MPIRNVLTFFLFLTVLWFSTSSVSAQGLQGDLDNDGDVDIFDYNILVRNFGNTTCGNQADIDGNCKVDIFDYNILVRNFGMRPSPTPRPSISPPPADVFNPRYPRLSHTTWGGAVADWYARFDLIDNNADNNPSFAQAVKAINPNTRIVVTRDFNQGLSDALQGVDEWKVKTSGGVVCPLYFEGDAYFNYTDLAPVRNTEYGSMRYNEYISYWMTDPKNIPLGVTTPNSDKFDGVMTDGLWDSFYGGPPCNSDIDLDANGLNDYVEHGGNWIDQQIHNGAIKILQYLRTRLNSINPNLLLVINSGGPHQWGMEYTNGYEYEHFSGTYIFDGELDRYLEWLSGSAKPSTPIYPAGGDINYAVYPSRNDFKFMRYGLTFVLMGDGYFDFGDKSGGEHYWVKYFDEYDVDLGYPKGAAQKLANGAWVRFFDNGLVLVNGSDTQDVTVTSDMIKNLAGYSPGSSGYYYRFKGGQDLAINGHNALNNGDIFDFSHPITLKITQPFYQDENTITPSRADGIILVREPKSIVSDIIIDNWNSGTSPGSASPSENKTEDMSGFLQATDCGEGSNYYTLRCAIYEDPNTSSPDEVYLSPPFALATGGSNAKAVYRPGIGVAGNYEVFEWHGSLNSGTLASNVNYTVNHAGGSSQRTVNQQQNSGQWNSLGTYYLNAGTSGNVSISASGANAAVMADAIMFRYISP